MAKSHPRAGNNHKAANEIHGENNQVKCNKLSSALTSDDFIGVVENEREIKAFSFLEWMKMSNNLRFIHIWQKEILVQLRSQRSKANEKVQFQQKFSSLPIAVSKS